MPYFQFILLSKSAVNIQAFNRFSARGKHYSRKILLLSNVYKVCPGFPTQLSILVEDAKFCTAEAKCILFPDGILGPSVVLLKNVQCCHSLSNDMVQKTGV